MYYSNDIIEDLRSHVDIVDFIGGYISLKKKGANYFGLCPFHNEKSPSFSVSSQNQMFYCFGCGAGGDVYKFLMDYENISFTESVEKLAEMTGYKLPESEDFNPLLKRKRDIRKSLLDLNGEAAMFFYNNFRSDEGVRGYKYLKDRGLSDKTIVHFGLGFADQKIDSLYQYLLSKGYENEILEKSGLFTFRNGKVYDKFFNRVIFPILDGNSRVIGFGGRVLGKGEPKYLNSPQTELFDKSKNLYGLNFAKKARKKYMILCEGYLDVISMHQAGFENSLASLGTAFTQGQAHLLHRYVDEIYLCYDSDSAGIKAARRAMEILRQEGLHGKVIDLKPYKDPDEFMEKLGKEEFLKRVEDAENVFIWSLKSAASDFDIKDPAGLTDYQHFVAGKLSEISDNMERENYIKAAARECMMDYEYLRRKVNEIGMNRKAYVASSRNDNKIENRQKKIMKESPLEKSEKQLLSWIAEKPKLKDKIREYIDEDDFTSGIYREIYKKLIDNSSVLEILDDYRDDEAKYIKVAEILNTKIVKDEEKEEVFKKAFEDLIRNIKLSSINRRIDEETDLTNLKNLILKEEEIRKLQIDI